MRNEINTFKLKNIMQLKLFIIILLLNISFVSGICGDNVCEKGIERAIITINYTGYLTTSNISTGQLINFNINNNEISFYLRLLSVNKETNISNFDYNGTAKNVTVGSINILTNEVYLIVNNLTLDIGSEEISCPNDCNQCNANADCNDGNLCTSDKCEGSPRKCKNANLPNCVANAYIKLGGKFILSNGTCKKEYKFISVDTLVKRIIFERTFPQSEINISYLNKTTNQFGYLVELKEEILGKVFSYNLRYDENKSLLYIGEAIIACPFIDACLSNKDCDDQDPCSIDECDGNPLRCKYKKIAYCKSGDRCCPAKCSYLDDNDCINPNKCNTDLDCFDNETCSLDRCAGEPRLCQNLPIVECITGDGCCARGCGFYEDQDCIRPIACGDKFCEGNESITCCTDCGCTQGRECINNTCIKPLNTEELLNKSLEIAKAKKELVDRKFVLKDKLLLKNNKGGFDFSYIYEKDGKFAYINGTIDKEMVLIGEFQSPPKYGFNYFYLFGILSAIIILAGATGISIHKKRKKKRDEYYARMLYQRYVMPQRAIYHHRHHPMHHRDLYQPLTLRYQYPRPQQYQYRAQNPYQRQYPQQRRYQQQWQR